MPTPFCVKVLGPKNGALTVNPTLLTTELLELGKGHEALGDNRRAAHAFRRAIKAAPARDLKEHALRTLLLACIHGDRLDRAELALEEFEAVASLQLLRAFSGALDFLEGAPVFNALSLVTDAMAAHVDFFAGLFLLAAGRRADGRRWLERFVSPEFTRDRRNAAAFAWEIKTARELLRAKPSATRQAESGCDPSMCHACPHR